MQTVTEEEGRIGFFGFPVLVILRSVFELNFRFWYALRFSVFPILISGFRLLLIKKAVCRFLFVLLLISNIPLFMHTERNNYEMTE